MGKTPAIVGFLTKRPWAWGLLLFGMSPSTVLGQVGLVGATARDEAALRMADAVLDEPTRRHESTAPRDATALLDEARAEWPEEIVVVVDTERALLRAIRSEDGTVVERRLDPSAVDAPYAVAQAVAELVTVAREAPLADTAAIAPPPAIPGRRSNPRRWSIAPEVGWELVASFADPLFLSGPSLGATFRIEGRRRFGGVGLRGHPMLELSRRGGAAEATYRRSDVLLEGTFGARSTNAWVGLTAQLALVFVKTEARDGPDREQHRRVAPWLGLGAEVAYRFSRGPFVRLGATVGALPDARDVQVRGGTVFQEGKLQIRSFLLLGWQLD